MILEEEAIKIFWGLGPSVSAYVHVVFDCFKRVRRNWIQVFSGRGEMSFRVNR